jgi:phosphohistidine phosphatase SixA
MRAGVRLALAALGVVASLAAASGRAQDAQAALAALERGGHVLVMRHAQTVPGTGDPPGFRLGDCSTQRNLSDGGREDARRVGERLRSAGVKLDRVLSSAWCRCVDTARIAFGTVEVWAPLNSFFDDRGTEPRQTRELRARVAAFRGEGNLALVTHQVNIAALTGEFLGSGEALVLEPAGESFRLVGRLPPPR